LGRDQTYDFDKIHTSKPITELFETFILQMLSPNNNKSIANH